MKKLLPALALLLGLLITSAAQATTRYVKPSCTNGITTYNAAADTCTGGSSTVYTTIPNGLAVTVAGDTLDVRAGTYATTLNATNVPSGTDLGSGAVTIKCHTGETCTLTGGIGLEGPAFVIFDGFTMRTAGIWVGSTFPGGVPTGHHIRFKDIDVGFISGDNQVNVNHFGHHVEFIGGSSHDAPADSSPNCTAAGTLACYAFYISGKDNLVEHAKIYSNKSYGIHNYSGYGPGQEPDRNVYRYNELYDNGSNSGTVSAALLCGSGDDCRAYGNIVRDNWGDGIASSNGATNTKIYNNTVYNNARLGNTYGGIMWGTGSGTIIKNNIVYQNNIADFADSNPGSQTPTFAGNFCTNADAARCAANGNPLFVDAVTAKNFSLQAGSPAINAGTASIASGITACANGSAPDIGAIETMGQPTATVNGTAAIITVVNNCTGQMLPATGVTGFTFKKNGSGDTVTANIRSGGNSYAATLTSAFVGGDTCLFSYSQTGNATSDNNIGGAVTSNQEILAFTDVACTNISGGGGGTVALSDWKIFLLQGATDTVWVQKCALNSTNCTVAPGSKLWIVSNLRNNSGSTFPTFNLSNRWRYNGGSYVTLTGSYVNAIKVLGTGQQLGTVVNDGTVMTADLIANRESTNVSCIASRSTSQVPAVALVDASEANCGQAIDIATTATPGDTYEDCPFTDTGTALTCATPIKITVGSYASAR